nr:anionic isoperoxidase A1 {N-terminal} {EC 1.11.1.7} [Raphanus sativus=Korean radishes, root, Peptide Partial, 26 aa] [Raphanus sativus]
FRLKPQRFNIIRNVIVDELASDPWIQ